MQPLEDDPFDFAAKWLYKPRTVLPAGLSLEDAECLGKGSNNRVLRATWNDQPVAFRMPRRRSDTQQKGAATWEFAQTLKASQLGVSPTIYAAWYARHATREYPSGMYLVTEVFDYDLEELYLSNSKREAMLAKSDEIATSIVRCLEVLVDAGLFLYDLKPGNVVVDVESGATKIIDFGREFCEWAGTDRQDRSTPVSDLVRELIKPRGLAAEEAAALARHVLFGVMLVQLASTTTRFLYEDRHRHRMDEQSRARANGLARLAKTFLDSLQGQNRALLRQVLRQDNVKGVMAHYHGRRNAGTRRTLRFAAGGER